MVTIRPFKALRPKPELASEVASLPYDVANDAEAREYKAQPNHFYHVTRAEIDLPATVDVHSNAVYEKARENFCTLRENGVMIEDEETGYYLYELTRNGHSQTGLVCGSSCNDYFNNIVRKHEFTRPEKEEDRIAHIRTTRAQTGMVFLTYRDVKEIQQVIGEWKKSQEPVNDFVTEDGVRHRIWVMDDYSKVAAITHLFATDVPCTYIADGHHRAASAGQVCMNMRKAGFQVTGQERFNFFLTAIFPESEMRIMDYNRVVKDLNGMSVDAFLKKVQQSFIVEEAPEVPYRPQQPQEFGMYVEGIWYRIAPKPDLFGADNLIASLDVSILQDHLLSPILGVEDPRTNNRIEFVGGIRGLAALEERVQQSADTAVAFSCYPVGIEQLLAVADSGQVMPPKSTWFEPKVRDGLIVYTI